MNKFLDYDDIEPYSEADAKEEYDEWRNKPSWTIRHSRRTNKWHKYHLDAIGTNISL